MNKRWIKLTGLVGLILLLLWWAFSLTGEDDYADILIQPLRGPFEVTVTVTGELRAKNSTEIKGPSNARKVRIWEMKISKLIPEGTVVKQGDLVAELDRSEIMDKIREAELQVQKAESQYTQEQLDTTLTLSEARNELINLQYNMEEMKLQKEQARFESPAIRRQAEIDYEKAGRAYQQAQQHYDTKVRQAVAKMKEASANLSQERQHLETYQSTMEEFTILAPADGMVIYDREWNGKKKVVGSTVDGWDPVVATLPDLSVMESLTYVNEVDIQKIKAGQPVSIGLDANPDKQLSGNVTDVANVGEQRPNSDSKVFEVTILVNEADSTLRPAMTTSNNIIVKQLEDALYIPLECIFTDDSLTYVYKKSGFRTVKQEVQIGLVNENHAAIEAGLAETDRVYLSTPADAADHPVSYLEKTPTAPTARESKASDENP